MKNIYFFFLLILVTAVSLSADDEKIGRIWNYNASTGLVTILPPVPGYFNMGEELFIYTEAGKLLGKARVERSYHTKAEAAVQEKIPEIERTAVAVKKPEDFSKAQKKRRSVVSYKEISNESRGWSVKVQFSGTRCETESRVQARKLDFGNVIGFREKNTYYYQAASVSEVKLLEYKWDGLKLIPAAITVNDRTLFADEIIASSAVKKISAPSSCKDEPQDVKIQLKKPGESSSRLIDVMPLLIDIQKPSKLKGKPAYIIKLYSNQKFIVDLVIDFEMMNREEIRVIMNLPVYYFSPGMNRLEAVLAEGVLLGDEVGEDKKNSVSLGTAELDLNGIKYDYSMKIAGKGKKLKLEVE